jgi:hypothetical protein
MSVALMRPFCKESIRQAIRHSLGEGLIPAGSTGFLTFSSRPICASWSSIREMKPDLMHGRFERGLRHLENLLRPLLCPVMNLEAVLV